MYQLKATGGNELQVIGNGDRGLCRVVGSNGQVKFRGTYTQCLRWMHVRAIRLLDEATK